MPTDPYVEPFDADAVENAGYRYTTNASLSSKLANRRLTDASLAIASFSGRRVIDIGCGDGTYTAELVTTGDSAYVAALDPAPAAVRLAKAKVVGRAVSVAVGSALALPYSDRSFDVAYLRGVLHHMDRPADAIGEALRVASVVVVVEPNGYNPVLKLLERYSAYHVEHGEKSYAPRQLKRWVEARGGWVEQATFAGLVPMFCPDWFARLAKGLEPIVEHVPGLRCVACAVYVFRAVAASPPAAPSDKGDEK